MLELLVSLGSLPSVLQSQTLSRLFAPTRLDLRAPGPSLAVRVARKAAAAASLAARGPGDHAASGVLSMADLMSTKLAQQVAVLRENVDSLRQSLQAKRLAPDLPVARLSESGELEEESGIAFRLLGRSGETVKMALQHLQPLFLRLGGFAEAKCDVKPRDFRGFCASLTDMSAVYYASLGSEYWRLVLAEEGLEQKRAEAKQAASPPPPLPSPTLRAPSQDESAESWTVYVRTLLDSLENADRLLDCYLAAAASFALCSAMAEAMANTEAFAANMQQGHKLASHLIRQGLPLVARLARLDPPLVKDNLLALSADGLATPMLHAAARHLVRKCQILHQVLSAADIFVFAPTMATHAGGVKALACSHLDRRFVMTGGYDSVARIWDVTERKCLAQVGDARCTAALLPACDLTALRPPSLARSQFVGHKSVVTWCAFNALDTWVATASFDGTIIIWNARTGKVNRTLAGHEDGILHCDLSASDKHIVSGSMDCTVRLWSVKMGKCLRVYHGHKHWVKAVRFDEAGTTVVSAGLDRVMFVWDATQHSSKDTSLMRPLHVLRSHEDYVLSLLFTGPSTLVSSSKDQSIRAWDLVSGKQSRLVRSAAAATAICLALSPSKRYVAAAYFDNAVTVHDAATLDTVRACVVHNEGILAIQFLSETTLAIGTVGGTVQVLTLAT
jgi:WD40 repeat protein